jgi:hypothetical protein
MSPGFTPAPSRKVRFTGILWQPPIGISDERNGNPLMLPEQAHAPAFQRLQARQSAE